MPYITPEQRQRIEDRGLPYVTDVGELTYVIDRMAEEMLWKLADYDFANVRYQHIAVILGALEAAKLEFQRRILALYEDRKRSTNGDVFHYPSYQESSVVDTDDPTVERESA